MTLDHVSVSDGVGLQGVGSSTDMLTFLNLATGFRYASPCGSKSAGKVFKQLQFYQGGRQFELVYTDNFPSLIRLAMALDCVMNALSKACLRPMAE